MRGNIRAHPGNQVQLNNCRVLASGEHVQGVPKQTLLNTEIMIAMTGGAVFVASSFVTGMGNEPTLCKSKRTV